MTQSASPSDLAAFLRGAAELLSNISDTPRLDAELLSAHLLQMERMEMLMRLADIAPPADFTEKFDAVIKRRMAHEPVAYIIGRQAFHDIEVSVTPDVLIPRSDSETLIDAAAEYFAGKSSPENILDMGTGSGALLLAALTIYSKARGDGIDASQAALCVARRNADDLQMAARTRMHHLSWHDNGWAGALPRPYDLILCNPPYVETDAALSPMVADFEPASALFAGADGLDDYRVIIPQIPALLSPCGIAAFEIGAAQADDISALAGESGLSATLHHDLSGRPRCVIMRDNSRNIG